MSPRTSSLTAVLALSLLAPVARAQTASVPPPVTVPAADLPDRAAEEKSLEKFETTAGSRLQQEPSLVQDKVGDQSTPKTEAPKKELTHQPLHIAILPMLSSGDGKDDQISTSISLNILAGHVGALRGVEVGTIFNSIGGKASGAQFSGVINKVSGTVNGAQFSGLVNVANESLSGAQFTAGVNYAKAVDMGSQVGLLNIGGDVKGAQIGLVNIAHQVKGAQVGVFNFANNVEGLSVGVLNFVRHGNVHLDLWSSDATLTNVSLRWGSKRFYSLTNVGYDPRGDGRRWSAGLGVGARMDAGRFFATADVSANTHFNGFTSLNRNVHTQARALVGIKLFERFSVFAGPTLNVNVDFDKSDKVERFGFGWGWTKNEGTTRVWPGVAAGIEI